MQFFSQLVFQEYRNLRLVCDGVRHNKISITTGMKSALNFFLNLPYVFTRFLVDAQLTVIFLFLTSNRFQSFLETYF